MRIALFVTICAVSAGASAANWPSWRGPDGTGVSTEASFPKTWSPNEHVKWKTALPEPGNSSPIVWEKKVFVTQARDKGAKRGVLCFDRADGKLLWEQYVSFDGKETTHKDNPYCSASPVTDGERVVAWLGSAGLVAYDLDGKELWKRDDLLPVNHIWGHASSPIIFKNSVIAYCGPGTGVLVTAVDKRTGKEIWRTPLPEAQAKAPGEFFGSWSTPQIFTASGRPELVLGLPKQLVAFDPERGAEVWRCKGLGPLIYTNPLCAGDTIVCMAGYSGAAIGVKAGGTGDVTETHRLWVSAQGIPQRVGSGVVVGGHIYILNDPGFAQCLEAKTGKEIWREKISTQNWGSMCHAGGKLYVTCTAGTTYVLDASTTFAKPQANPLNEMCRASPAFSDGQIFIRTYAHLYCIGE